VQHIKKIGADKKSLKNFGRKTLKPLGRHRHIYTWIILKWLLKKDGLDSAVRGHDPIARFCKHYNELSCSIKSGGFLD
jgi:hypothetical protein